MIDKKEYFSSLFKNSIDSRKKTGLLRKLGQESELIDFSSNDYLGFSHSKEFYSFIKDLERQYSSLMFSGAGASRLINGNHPLYQICEDEIARFHNSETSLIFNSGYDANTGLISALSKKDLTIIYDEYCHASIRDGIRLGFSRSYSFRHGDLEDFRKKLDQSRGKVLAIVESVYSMDGILLNPNHSDFKKSSSQVLNRKESHYWIEEFIDFCCHNEVDVIVDEAHGTGVFGKNGEGVVSECRLENKVLARIHTFGKALGVHGAAVTGSHDLKEFLINYARPLIYSTALPPHSLLSILASYRYLVLNPDLILKLRTLIEIFEKEFYPEDFLNPSAIHYKMIPGNDKCREKAGLFREKGFDVRPILSPTVPENRERLRICLHAFNTESQVKELVKITGKWNE